MVATVCRAFARYQFVVTSFRTLRRKSRYGYRDECSRQRRKIIYIVLLSVFTSTVMYCNYDGVMACNIMQELLGADLPRHYRDSICFQ